MELFEKRGEEIDMALLDVVMPGMGGREVREQMIAVRPDIRVLFTSGYTENAVHTNFVLDHGLTLIQKPYSTDALLRAVRTVLDQT
jgi:two-component SAPR family response regulator